MLLATESYMKSPLQAENTSLRSLTIMENVCQLGKENIPILDKFIFPHKRFWKTS